MKYEVVIFDADGVLFDFERAEKFALEGMMKHYKLEYDPEYHLKHYKEINSAVWDEFERELISAEALKSERFRRFFDRIGMNLNPQEVSLRYMDYLSEAGFLLEGAVEILEGLKEKVRLVLMTNGLSLVQNGRLKQSDLAKYFEEIIISEEIGYAKPNPEIFKIAFEKIKYNNKKKVLMVGDSLKSDVQGGINFGIDTCWFNPMKKENKSGLIPTYEIGKLKEIRDIVLEEK